MELVLQRRAEPDRSTNIGPVIVAPANLDDYWSYRVALTSDQAIVGFPKFGTIGIGFEKEEDWNTNLPYAVCSKEEIFEHIKHNKGDESISDNDCIRAIQMIREAASEDTGRPLE